MVSQLVFLWEQNSTLLIRLVCTILDRKGLNIFLLTYEENQLLQNSLKEKRRGKEKRAGLAMYNGT
jgi:hypothetical protein